MAEQVTAAATPRMATKTRESILTQRASERDALVEMVDVSAKSKHGYVCELSIADGRKVLRVWEDEEECIDAQLG
jgi:hypothetical protein